MKAFFIYLMIYWLMQIITFYINSLKLISIIRAPEIVSALIGAGVALLVFYLTIQNDKKKDKEKQKEIYDYRMRYLASLVKSSITFTHNTIENLLELSDKIKKDNITYHLITYNPNNSFDRIKELIKNEGYFSAYMSTLGKDKTDEYNDLAELVDYFKMQIDFMHDLHKTGQKLDHERKKELISYIDSIIDDGISKPLNEELTHDDQAKISKCYDKYLQHKPSPENFLDSTTFNIEFIIQLREIILTYHLEPNSNKLLRAIKSTTSLYEEIKFHNRNHDEDIIQLKGDLEEALIKYKKTTGCLQNYYT